MGQPNLDFSHCLLNCFFIKIVRFSTNGEFLYTVSYIFREASYLTKWDVQKITFNNCFPLFF